MAYRGSQHYDKEDFLKSYLELRKWTENANDTLEKPIIEELAGDVRGKSVLDLGCGTASYGAELLDRGALEYTGLEGSANMVALSLEALKNYPAGHVIHTSLEEWSFTGEAYDMAVSRLVMHYVEDIEPLFNKIYATLKAGGSFVFSVEHPVLTSSYGLPKPSGQKQDWVVDRYFETGAREQEWLGRKVMKFHRTVEDYFLALRKAGFMVEQVRESKPDPKHFDNMETYERRKRIPLFLFLKGSKREAS